MEPEVPVKKLETMVKLDAVRRVASPWLAGHRRHIGEPGRPVLIVQL